MNKSVIFICVLFIARSGNSQEVVRISSGINISNVKQYVIVDNSKSDTNFSYRKNLILPTFDIQKQINLFDKVDFSFGVGIGWYGAKDFNKGVPSQFNLDENLKIGYLQFPLEIWLKPINKGNILIGYALRYPFRKNVNFEVFDKSNHVINIYNPIHHFITIGLSIPFGSFSFDIKYDFQINTIFDSEDYLQDTRGYAKIKNFNFGISLVIQ